jgi:hypothetical protein
MRAVKIGGGETNVFWKHGESVGETRSEDSVCVSGLQKQLDGWPLLGCNDYPILSWVAKQTDCTFLRYLTGLRMIIPEIYLISASPPTTTLPCGLKRSRLRCRLFSSHRAARWSCERRRRIGQCWGAGNSEARARGGGGGGNISIPAGKCIETN